MQILTKKKQQILPYFNYENNKISDREEEKNVNEFQFQFPVTTCY